MTDEEAMELLDLFDKDEKKFYLELEKLGIELKRKTSSELLEEIELKFPKFYDDEVIEELIEESGGKLTKDLIHKKFIVERLLFYMHGVLFQFFDRKSYELLDLKIEVMTALIDGKTPYEIPGYDDIFEKMPPKGQLWD